MSRRRAVAVFAAFACLALPAVAAASTAYESGSPGALVLHFDAASGEANHADVGVSGSSITVKDTVARPTTGFNCFPGSGKTVSCVGSGVVGFHALLGDMDDQLVVSAPLTATVDGGAGNDGIGTGPASGDVLIGGDGHDIMEGGAGADLILGGPGSDTIYYAARVSAVVANLDGVAGDGEAGENDTLGSDVENLWAGWGSDTLTGNSAANWLYGGPGNDVLDGAAGADTFMGDVGADTIYARDGYADNVQCGTEIDTVQADPLDVVNADCEKVSVANPPPPPPGTPPPPPGSDLAPGSPLSDTVPLLSVPTIGSAPVKLTSTGVLPVTVGCPATAASGCSGYVIVDPAASARRAVAARRGRRGLGRRSFRVTRGRSAVIKVHVSRRGRKRLARRRARVKVSVYTRSATGGYTKTSKVLTVRN